MKVLTILALIVLIVNVRATTTASYTTVEACVLKVKDGDLVQKISALKDVGTNLIEYHVTMDEENKLLESHNLLYQPHRWHRVFNRHGEVLLSLAFNYDMLSLSLLNIGVEHLEVVLHDSPSGCLASLGETDAINAVADILMRDFDEGVEPIRMDLHQAVCHQELKINDGGFGEFVDKCCSRFKSNNNNITCSSIEAPHTINVLYTLLVIIKISFLLFGPLYLQGWIFSEPLQKKVYTVPMSDELNIKMTSEELRKYTDQESTNQANPFKPSVDLDCKLKTLHIVVDHGQLMTERQVPVGFFRYIFDNIFLCKLMNSQPFRACCSQSIFGSWTQRFLFLPLFSNETSCNRRWKRTISWGHVFRLIGALGIFVLISLPFLMRVVIFYVYENPEIISRKAALDAKNVKPAVDYNIFQFLTPAHWALRAVYALYCLSLIILAICHKLYPVAMRNLLMPALADLQNVSYIEVVRMVISHLLLPFEKFGLVGLLVSLLYLPIALCACIVAIACYCVPTLYMIGRVFIHHRPSFLKLHNKTSGITGVQETIKRTANKPKKFLSQGTRCVDDILMLENISHDEPSTPVTKRQKAIYSKNTAKERAMRKFPKLIQIPMAFAIIINMLAILGMYAEVTGFLAEAIVLTLMGAIINASTAHKYVMLVFWMTMYSTSCFNKVYEAYSKVNRKLFSFVKNKLGSEVMTYMMLPEDEHQDIAFKFFSRTEMQKFDEDRRLRSAIVGCEDSENTDVDDVLEEELIRVTSEAAYWKTCSLALFVDQNHVPRIPKKLFFLISQQEVLGCPGPIYKSMARATKNLLNMILFLVFVFIIILTFGDIYHLSSTNQLILTAVGGFIPDIIRRVLQPKVDIDIDLNTYTFHQKIQQILCNYKELWPVAEIRCVSHTEADRAQ